MPHSGGGGSHGGGSHGGSHGSGGRSHSTSSRYFHGSTRFVYYRNKKPVYVYANYDITKRNELNIITFIFQIFGSIPFIAFSFLVLFLSISVPHKLSTNYKTGYYVDDRIGILRSEDAILERMDTFYEVTGITPVFITIHNSDWNGKYKELTDYAYDEYLSLFQDEKHMLIVYSQPENPDPKFNDWYWELMQGNDTDPILTSKVDDRFRETFHKNLLKENVTVENALVSAFDEITPGITKGVDIDWAGIVFVLVAFVATGFNIWYAIVKCFGKKAKLMQKAVICPQLVDEVACEYCTGVYVIGTCKTCPHCGAPAIEPLFPEQEVGEDPFEKKKREQLQKFGSAFGNKNMFIK